MAFFGPTERQCVTKRKYNTCIQCLLTEQMITVCCDWLRHFSRNVRVPYFMLLGYLQSTTLTLIGLRNNEPK